MQEESTPITRRQFKVDTQRIFSERFENDSIIIDLNTGIYFSLNYTGSIVWEAILQGLPAEDITRVMVDKMSSDPETPIAGVALEVSNFLDKLQQHSLAILEVAAADKSEINFDFELSSKNYSPPSIEAHIDVKDLLLADIVHSVDSDGWPIISTEQ